ncbi:DNA-3-methyladenine glycosylase [Acidipila sp. EB88]|uniref:DNA-3-methyladenine glycosylase n=1 Tax=Acidipila sp. EB88 TaxID=2305226 RepID=UPI000F5F068C|nr:DNA-3-methyladenine glycosylase [Acidipila sp. EB88]RRA48100.1 DNA-3-methyladenine glycosylase [Acidipila sp. EB88]
MTKKRPSPPAIESTSPPGRTLGAITTGSATAALDQALPASCLHNPDLPFQYENLHHLAIELPGTSPIPRSLFLHPPDHVAQAMLGKLVVRRLPGTGELLAGRIVETEAYFGSDDPAAHAASGRTARNAVLWDEPAHAYVYFIYGMHSCLNVSCEPAGHAGCVLIRALEPVRGLDTMRRLRALAPEAPSRLLASGPGRLCQALAITRTLFNGVDLLDPASLLQLLEPAPEAEAETIPDIASTPRIGIRKAVDRLLRFHYRGNPHVSGPRAGSRSTA